MPERTISRATVGERVAVILNHVKADKRELHERFINDYLRPAAEQAEPAITGKVRFLHPTEPNENGTYTYIFIMDPVVDGADYNIESLLKRAYGEEKAQEYNQMWFDSLAEEQVAYEVIQSPW